MKSIGVIVKNHADFVIWCSEHPAIAHDSVEIKYPKDLHGRKFEKIIFYSYSREITQEEYAKLNGILRYQL